MIAAVLPWGSGKTKVDR